MALAFPPVSLSVKERVQLTLSCRDADNLPRVDRAGEVHVDPETGIRVQYMHNGLRVEEGCYYGAWMTELISALKGVHEPQEEVVFDSILKHIPAQATMVELGAFWSYYTIWFLMQQRGLGRGIGLEMDPAHLEKGRANAKLNGVDIELILGRVGARNEVAAPYMTESSGMQKIPTFGIEGLMHTAKVDRVDLLLCDAQGGEIDLLEGMQASVSQGKIGVLVMSTHHHAITGDPLTHQRALALIEGLGGYVRLEHDVAESYSGDGLIVADFDGSLDSWSPPSISYCRTSKSLFRDPLYDLACSQSREKELVTKLGELSSDHSQDNEPFSGENVQSKTVSSWWRRLIR